MMQTWDERSSEVANLLNPAFCGEILRRSIVGYQKYGSSRMPFVLTFLILPMILHESTRAKISLTKRPTLHIWVNENPQIRIGFAERTRSLNDFTRESLIFLMSHEELAIEQDGRIVAFKELARNAKSGDINEIFQKSETFGKMLAKSGSVSTVFSLLGVRP